MILFLLLNIFLLNTKLFSAEEQKFLDPINTVRNRQITAESFIREAFLVIQKDKEYATRSFLGGFIGLFTLTKGIDKHAENKLLQTIRTIEIYREKLKQEPNQLKSLITSLDELKSQNRNIKKYMLGSIIITIFSFFLSQYFYKKAEKKLENNLEIALAPETAALWNNLFQIENKESLDKDFLNTITEAERIEEKKINKKINFFKKIIKIRQLVKETNKSENLTKEEKRNIQIKIANLLLFYPCSSNDE